MRVVHEPIQDGIGQRVIADGLVPEDMNLPGWRFHRLHGDLKDHYSVWVNGNWRIIFKFDDEPQDVDLVDYH